MALVLRPLLIAFCLFAALLAALELRLAQLNYVPTIVDSADRWIVQRLRASRLGGKALIIVGASRIQLGLDMETLRRETGKEPVQLAVLGSSPVTVLAGLAADPTVVGTIVVDYYDGFAMADTAVKYQEAYFKKLATNPLLTVGQDIETRLTHNVRDNLRSYAGGATPLTSLRLALAGKPRQLHVTTLPDRSCRADYSRVPMPAFYHRNVMRSLGISLDTATPDLGRILQRRVDAVERVDNRQFLTESLRVRDMITAIRRRGGDVIFVKMPTGGMVKETEARQFPREEFWTPFLRLVDAPGIWTPDLAEVAALESPDGSHLDSRDQQVFTRALVHAMKLARPALPR